MLTRSLSNSEVREMADVAACWIGEGYNFSTSVWRSLGHFNIKEHCREVFNEVSEELRRRARIVRERKAIERKSPSLTFGP